MKKNWEEKTTNQLILESKTLHEKHESVKNKILKLVDELEGIEEDFKDVNNILVERLK